MAERDLQCPNGCEPRLFEALNAIVLVDARGRQVRLQTDRSTFVCATCRSVAIDLAAVAEEMAADAEPTPQVLVCPGCRLEMLPPEDDPFATLVECPECGTRFTLEEGMPRLFGTEPADLDDENCP